MASALAPAAPSQRVPDEEDLCLPAARTPDIPYPAENILACYMALATGYVGVYSCCSATEAHSEGNEDESL